MSSLDKPEDTAGSKTANGTPAKTEIVLLGAGTAAIRAKTGLSQRGFSRALGISINTLRSWEQGRRNPSGAAATLLRAINRDPQMLDDLNA